MSAAYLVCNILKPNLIDRPDLWEKKCNLEIPVSSAHIRADVTKSDKHMLYLE